MAWCGRVRVQAGHCETAHLEFGECGGRAIFRNRGGRLAVGDCRRVARFGAAGSATDGARPRHRRGGRRRVAVGQIAQRAETTYKVKMTDNVAIRGIVKAALADIKHNSSIGVTGMPQADGTQKAVEIGESFRKLCAAPAKDTGPGTCCPTAP